MFERSAVSASMSCENTERKTVHLAVLRASYIFGDPGVNFIDSSFFAEISGSSRKFRKVLKGNPRVAIRFPWGPKGSTQGTSVQMQCSHGASHGGHHLELVTAVTLRNSQKYDLVSHVFVDGESLEFETCQTNINWQMPHSSSANGP